jgi:NAD(P) transhydrogenase subunit alpha
MDALSSQALVAGYQATLLAAERLPRFFPMFMTAAGTIPPAKVLVVGAGVAGLQAIATARRLGANVVATDVRPEVKEQIESVGGKYVGIELTESAAAGGGYAKELSAADQQRQREILAAQCAQSDVVITTALIGGVFAPRLISAAIVESMAPGSIIVDLAGDSGGNCELTEAGKTVVEDGVKVISPLNLPSEMAEHASALYARNVEALIGLGFDFDDEIVSGSCVTRGGAIRHEPTRVAIEGPAPNTAGGQAALTEPNEGGSR